MKKISNYQKLKNQFAIIEKKYNDTVFPYQLAINNIDTQYKAITNALNILKNQEEAKRNEVSAIFKKEKNKRSFFNEKRYIQYSVGCNIFIDNSGKLWHEYNNILIYLSLKKLFINCQIDYITINTISEVAYYIHSLYGNFHIQELLYKKYNFVYKLLSNRSLCIKNNAIWAGVDNYYIYNYKYANSPNEPYKALTDLFEIKVPANMLAEKENFEDTFFTPFHINVVPADKIYIIVNRFLEQIKIYCLKLRELENIKVNARYIINRSNTNIYYDTFIHGYNIKDICENYNYGCTAIKDLVFSYKSI